MGMFDWVDYKEECPLCGEFLQYQTKDLHNILDLVPVSLVDKFYSGCTCNADIWIKYVRSDSKLETAVRSKVKNIKSDKFIKTAFLPDKTYEVIVEIERS